MQSSTSAKDVIVSIDPGDGNKRKSRNGHSTVKATIVPATGQTGQIKTTNVPVGSSGAGLRAGGQGHDHSYHEVPQRGEVSDRPNVRNDSRTGSGNTAKRLMRTVSSRKLIIVLLLALVAVAVVAAVGATVMASGGGRSSRNDTGNGTADSRGVSTIGPAIYAASTPMQKREVGTVTMPTTTTGAVAATSTAYYTVSATATTPLPSSRSSAMTTQPPEAPAPTENCVGFRCKSSGLCLQDAGLRQCDGVFDCDDLSDEMGCPGELGMRFCTNGVRVSLDVWCDGLDDCGDNSDELSCVCEVRGEFTCSDTKGYCIPTDWVCDGYADCEDGRDEQGCGVCSASEFNCQDHSCIPMTKRCDGRVDCVTDGEDETGCLSVSEENHLLVLTTDLQGKTSMSTVCAQGWTDELAKEACTEMDAGLVDYWRPEEYQDSVSGLVAVVNNFNSSVSLLKNVESVTACQDRNVVHISCKPPDPPSCGQRKLILLPSLVASGFITPPGKWPWMVAVVEQGKPMCGGVILNNRWVATAAHCVVKSLYDKPLQLKDPSTFTVIAGTNFINTSSLSTSLTASQQTFQVSQAIFHPNSVPSLSGGVDWDIALLQLETTDVDGDAAAGLVFSQLVQPICLPDIEEEFLPSSECYIAGWGTLSYRQYLGVQDLRDGRMSIWSEESCRQATIYLETEVDTDHILCGGLGPGRPLACQGDSGGPLMCLDHRSGLYKLAGIISRGGSKCGGDGSNNRFVKVSATVDWINSVLDGQQ